MTTDLTCPKCMGLMRAYERNVIRIDQYAECRGIFLDRGELERLMDAEEQRYASSAPRSSGPRYGDDPAPRSGYDDPPRGSGHHGGSSHDNDNRSAKRKRSGFLGELFD